MMNICFTVPGEPRGKARPKVTRMKSGKSLTYTPDKTVAYEELVRLRFTDSAPEGFHFDAGTPLYMIVSAYMGVPKSKPKRQQADMLANILRPTKKPDWDNIGKIVCDALNDIAYADDAQIVEARIVKLYSYHPRVEVEIGEIKDLQHPAADL